MNKWKKKENYRLYHTILSCLTLGWLVLVPNAQAELSADLTIASKYLFRGIDYSDSQPVLQSSVQYAHSSGFYLGSWFSNAGMPERVLTDKEGNLLRDKNNSPIDAGSSNGSGFEIDLYTGYTASRGDFSYSLGLAGYYYPEANASPLASDSYEFSLGAGYKSYSTTLYINLEPDVYDDYKYLSIDGPVGPLLGHLGTTLYGKSDGYSDVSVSYNFTPRLSWSLVYAFGDAIVADSSQDDPVIVVSYKVPLD
ncbi:MAG: TorF family putative porin [Gammaproteobacteria bacterium]|nr:TorF family putative porin [Gammaproteobacteria bacterium]